MVERESLEVRMRRYEGERKRQLDKREPVVVRLDMRAGSNYTSVLYKPFDEVYTRVMDKVLKEMMKEQGVIMGYTQSDEITIVMQGYRKEDTELYFGGKEYKMLSVLASKVTRLFNKYMREVSKEIGCGYGNTVDLGVYESRYDEAEFDARVFNIPKEEVVNNLIWRQQDCKRNAVSMVGQVNYPAKSLKGVSMEGVKERLREEKGIDYEKDISQRNQYGLIVYQTEEGLSSVSLEITKAKDLREELEKIVREPGYWED